MKKIIEDLYKLNRNLLGEGYDQALEYINKIIPLDIIEIPSGTKLETWTIPNEWIIRDAWVKIKNKKILDYKKEPLSLMVYSKPVHGIVDLKELKKHLFISDEEPEAIPYAYNFYERDWNFCVTKNQIKEKIPDKCEGGICVPDLKKIDPSVGKVKIEGFDYSPKYKDKLKEGNYEIFIDSEFKPGKLKIGVHTIKGKSDREILLFAHLDHPHQANDNLSGVACLIDLAKQIKCDHTIKIIFCPETMGSIAYALTQNISKVDFVIAIDICGNDNTLLIQKAFNKFDRINYIAHEAIEELGVSYRKGDFRLLIGSDEYIFNDPKIGIPGILLSRFPYSEYHTSKDTPEIIKEEMIKETQQFILKMIEIYEKDYIPVRNFKGPLMRSAFGLQTRHKLLSRDTDYLIYDIDGKKYLSEIVLPLGLIFSYAYDFLEKLKKAGFIYGNSSPHISQK